jgi:hypothetical protein
MYHPSFPRQGRLRRLSPLLLGAAALALAASCSGGSSNSDGGPHDWVVVDVTFGEVPPECEFGGGNEKGVGAHCTEGGGQCKPYGNSICTCDPLGNTRLPDGSPCICITPILGMTCDQIPADYCGRAAGCCSYMGNAGCFPAACLDMGMCPAL